MELFGIEVSSWWWATIFFCEFFDGIFWWYCLKVFFDSIFRQYFLSVFFWQYFYGIFWRYVLTVNIEFISWWYVLKLFFEFWQYYLMIFKTVLTERALDKSTLELVDLKAKVFNSRTFGCNWNVKNGVLVDPWSPHFLPCFLYWNWQDL